VGSTMRPVTLRRSPLIGVTLFVLLGLGTASCGGGSDPEDDGHTVVPAVNATTAPLLPTDAAELPTFDAGTYQTLLGQLKGTPVVVNIWGSWCAPCRDEAAALVAAHRRYGHDVQFVGIDILDARGSARDYQHEFKITYPSVFDQPGRIRDSLGVLGQPVTLFYDRAGALVDRWMGAIPQDELQKGIDEITGDAAS
jgi:thiol-disulfide isomerase/thioredoxin